MKPNEFATLPTVYAVGKNYQIIVPVTKECVMWVKIGDRCFYDDSNGILRSASTTHKMTLPMELLDEAKAYTVCYRNIIERKPYYSELSDVFEYTSAFRPVKHDGAIRICHISDAHNRVAEPVAVGGYFRDSLDLLILNGDIPNHSGDIKLFTAIHEIAAGITKGEIPVVFSRGNHDMRGIFAEKLEEHVPTDMGRSYFTFRLGRLWGLVLDSGEDKPDGGIEYGHTICCEDFRRRETEFIKSVIERAEGEYSADGVENRIVICHNPFTETLRPPFDIEIELFTEWARLLGEHIKPQFMLCGHIHKAYVSGIGSEHDHKGQPCPVIVASKVSADGAEYIGGAIELYPDRCDVKFINQDLLVKGEETIEI